MVDFQQKEKYNFNDLLRIMEILRAPDGCMWDREQDHQSIRRNFIEETYEVCEAIDEQDTEHLKEELGDVLLQVVFHAQMEKEKGVFDIEDVADGVCKKLIFRHPHIFGTVEVGSSEEILRNWDELKRKEKHQKTDTDTLTSVAKSLPGLIRAEKLQKKAAKVGFDWDGPQGALDKVAEELDEVRRAAQGDGDPEEEIGDLLFAAVNAARHLKVDPERAMEKTCNKFIRRFAAMERQARSRTERFPICRWQSWTRFGIKPKKRNRQKRRYHHEEKRICRGCRGEGRPDQKGHGKGDGRVFETIGDVLAPGDKLQISGFGTFETRTRAARTGHNPRTGEEIAIAAATIPAFKPGKALKDKVDAK